MLRNRDVVLKDLTPVAGSLTPVALGSPAKSDLGSQTPPSGERVSTSFEQGIVALDSAQI